MVPYRRAICDYLHLGQPRALTRINPTLREVWTILGCDELWLINSEEHRPSLITHLARIVERDGTFLDALTVWDNMWFRGAIGPAWITSNGPLDARFKSELTFGQRIRYIHSLVDRYPEQEAWRHLYILIRFVVSDPRLLPSSFRYLVQFELILPPHELKHTSVTPPKDVLSFLTERVLNLEGE